MQSGLRPGTRTQSRNRARGVQLHRLRLKEFSIGAAEVVTMPKPVITSSPEILGGTQVFAGTRVPVQTFLEYMREGESIESFLQGFPSVKREQVLRLLEQLEVSE